jgi:hypothetical protein
MKDVDLMIQSSKCDSASDLPVWRIYTSVENNVLNSIIR